MALGAILIGVAIALSVISLTATAVTVHQSKQKAKRASAKSKANSYKFQIPREGVDHPLPVVYGTRELAPVRVFTQVGNEDMGQIKNERLFVILVWAVGEVDAVERIYMKDEKWRSGKFIPELDDGRDGLSGCAIHHHLGKGKAHIPSWFKPRVNPGAKRLFFNLATASGEFYDFTDWHFEGLVTTFIMFQMTEANPHWSKGYPDMRARLRGRTCYDPRTGQTAYTENPAIQLYDYALDKDYGMELDPSQVRVESIINSANHFDQLVDTPEGQQPLFSSNLLVDTELSHKDNVDIMLGNVRGYLPESDLLDLRVEDVAEPVMHLDDDMIVGEITVSEAGADEVYNQVVVRFPNKHQRFKYSEAVFPEPDSALDKQWLEEDNGKRYSTELTMEAITNPYEALQMAEVQARLSRANGAVTIKEVMPECVFLESMDVITLDDEIMGWDAKPFRVGKVDVEDDGKVSLELLEYQPSCYPWSDKPHIVYPETNHVAPFIISTPADLAYEPLDEGLHQAKLSWTLVLDYWVKGYDWQIVSGDEVIQSGRVNEPFVLLENLPAGNYTARVRSVRKEVVSEWSVLPILLTAPSAPTSCAVEASGGAIRLYPAPKPLAFGAEFEFYASDSQGTVGQFLGRGISLSHNDLYPDTVYWYQVRAVNKYGQSAYLHVQAKTTLDQSQLLARLKKTLTKEQLSDETLALIETLEAGKNGSLPDRLDHLSDDLDQAMIDLNNEIDQATDQIAQEKLDRQQAQLEFKHYIDGVRQRLEKGVDDAQSQVVQAFASFANLNKTIEVKIQQQLKLIDALVEIDYETGQITNRAYAYTDGQFTKAETRMDGMKGKIDLEAERLTATEYSLQQAQSAISLHAGLINQRATYTEVNSAINQQVGSAIDALTPAYSWQFNSGADGFTGAAAASGALLLIKDQFADKTGISFAADDNPVIRARVKLTGDWVGVITNAAGDFTLTLPAPTSNEWEVVTLDATGATGYAGTITDIRLNLGDVELDYLTIGKQSANDLALKDITARTSTVEQELDANNARWAQYLTHTQFESQAVTFTNFEQVFEGVEGKYGLLALKAEIDETGIIQKAVDVHNWIDLTHATAGDWLAAYVADTITPTLTTIEQKADALEGTLQSQIQSVAGLEKKTDDQGAALVEQAYAKHKLLTGQIEANDKIALANQKQQAQATELEAKAQEISELKAALGGSLSEIDTLKIALTNANKALALATTTLESTIETKKAEAISAANALVEASQSTLADADAAIAQDVQALESAFETEQSSTTARFNETNQAVANTNSALTENTEVLNAKIGEEKTEVLKTLRAESGWICIDDSGKPTTHRDAVACVNAGHNWLNRSTAEIVQAVSLNTGDGQSATITQLMQAFRKEANGDVTLRGGLLLDNDGRVTGVVNTATNNNSLLEFIGDGAKFIDPDTKLAAFSWDSDKRSFVFKGVIASDSRIESPLILAPELNVDPETGQRIGDVSIKNGILYANKAIFKDVEIQDAQGNTIFSSGNLSADNVTGLGDLASKDESDLNLAQFAKDADMGALAGLDKITSASQVSLTAIQTLLANQVIAAEVYAGRIKGDVSRRGSIECERQVTTFSSAYHKVLEISGDSFRGDDSFLGKDVILEIEFYVNAFDAEGEVCIVGQDMQPLSLYDDRSQKARFDLSGWLTKNAEGNPWWRTGGDKHELKIFVPGYVTKIFLCLRCFRSQGKPHVSDGWFPYPTNSDYSYVEVSSDVTVEMYAATKAIDFIIH